MFREDQCGPILGTIVVNDIGIYEVYATSELGCPITCNGDEMEIGFMYFFISGCKLGLGPLARDIGGFFCASFL